MARKLLSVTQAAQTCGVTSQTIRYWIQGGYLRAYRMGPKTIRIDAVDLEKLIRPTIEA